MSLKVEGEIKVGEASSVAMKVHRHLFGRPWYVWLLLFAAGLVMVGCMSLLAPWLVRITGEDSLWLVTPTVVGVITVVAVQRLNRMICLRHNLSRLKDHGVSGSFPVTVEISDDALTMTTGGVTNIARWSSVSEVFLVGDYWVFIVQGGPFYVPRRFFADTAAQKEFIAGAIRRMDDAGKARSWRALAQSCV